jgi:hypothetical protein
MRGRFEMVRPPRCPLQVHVSLHPELSISAAAAAGGETPGPLWRSRYELIAEVQET